MKRTLADMHGRIKSQVLKQAFYTNVDEDLLEVFGIGDRARGPFALTDFLKV